jgi:histidyl-tRNA synthetase
MLDIYVMSTEKTRPMALFIATALRNAGYRTDLNFVDRPFKRLFKKADKENALFAIIIGEDELKDSNVSIKNLKTEIQQTVPITEMFTKLDEMMDDYQKHLQDEKAKEKDENDVSK